MSIYQHFAPLVQVYVAVRRVITIALLPFVWARNCLRFGAQIVVGIYQFIIGLLGLVVVTAFIFAICYILLMPLFHHVAH